jgi:ribosomal protein S18 acetylase RimI-like enzyme
MAEIRGVILAAHTTRAIRPHDVLTLYEAEGWWPDRTAEQVAAVLSTGPAVGAWRDDEMVGFARAVTDGTLRAYAEDVIVAPALRHAAIGHALIDLLIQVVAPVPLITLFSSADLVPFYALGGFRPTRQVVMHRSLTHRATSVPEPAEN